MGFYSLPAFPCSATRPALLQTTPPSNPRAPASLSEQSYFTPTPRQSTSAGNASRSRFGRAIHLAPGVFGGDRLPLVVLALALGQPDLELDPVARPVEAQRDQRQAFLLDGDAQPNDLGLVQQQLPFALGLVIAAVTALVGTDMHVDEERLSPTKPNIAF